MKSALFAALALSAVLACTQEKRVVTPTDTREVIELRYIASPEVIVRAQPNDTAKEVAKYPIGESVSVLAKQGEWVEIRSGDGSGWVRASDLQSAQEKAAGEENPVPKFQRMPMPISAPSAHGEIYIEADVNTDGDVVQTKILSNTTGSDSLAAQNAEHLKAAKFYPLTIKGERKTFKYYHKVTY